MPLANRNILKYFCQNCELESFFTKLILIQFQRLTKSDSEVLIIVERPTGTREQNTILNKITDGSFIS